MADACSIAELGNRPDAGELGKAVHCWMMDYSPLFAGNHDVRQMWEVAARLRRSTSVPARWSTSLLKDRMLVVLDEGDARLLDEAIGEARCAPRNRGRI